MCSATAHVDRFPCAGLPGGGETSSLDNRNVLQAHGSQPWDGTSAPVFVEPILSDTGPAFGAKPLTDSPRQADQVGSTPPPPRSDVVPERVPPGHRGRAASPADGGAVGQAPPSLPADSTTAAPVVQPSNPSPKPNEEPLDPPSSAAGTTTQLYPVPAVPSATRLPPNAQRLLNLLLSSPSTLRQLNAILGYIAAMNPPSMVPVDCHYREPSSAEGSTLNMAFVKYLTDLPRNRQTSAAVDVSKS